MSNNDDRTKSVASAIFIRFSNVLLYKWTTRSFKGFRDCAAALRYQYLMELRRDILSHFSVFKNCL